MDKERKDIDKDKDQKKNPSRGKKGDRYEIDRGKEPHKHQDSPDHEEDQTR